MCIGAVLLTRGSAYRPTRLATRMQYYIVVALVTFYFAI
jgi:hypothetical protein